MYFGSGDSGNILIESLLLDTFPSAFCSTKQLCAKFRSRTPQRYIFIKRDFHKYTILAIVPIFASEALLGENKKNPVTKCFFQ